MEQNLALSNLLLSLFNSYELRRYLTSGNQGNSISYVLPGNNASLTELADEGVSALVRYGVIDEVFWSRLIETRPGRIGDIKKVQSMWNNVGSNEVITSTINIVFLSSNPDPNSPLAVDKEYRRILKAIESTKYRDKLKMIPLPDAHITDLPLILRRNEPTIVHFSGHGTETGQLLMKDDEGVLIEVDPDGISGLICMRKKTLKLVVLNACFSEILAEKIVKDIDFVIGMHAAVYDDAAITFARTFYEAFGDGVDLQEAFETGIRIVKSTFHREDDVPRLLIKEGVDPSQFFLVDKL
jgi:hypothetical protein